MLRKMLGTFTAVAAALVFVGVAWASTDATTTSTSLDETTSTSTGESTSTSMDDATSTTIDDDTTSTTINDDTTSTTIDDDETTSTTVDDDEATVASGVSTHTIPGVGSVTIEVANGRLMLVGYSASGWNLEKQRVEPDRIELEFSQGESEAEFEARLDNGQVRVEVEVDSD